MDIDKKIMEMNNPDTILQDLKDAMEVEELLKVKLSVAEKEKVDSQLRKLMERGILTGYILRDLKEEKE